MKQSHVNVYLCGQWDGVNLWLQWDEFSEEGYRVEVRYRESPETEWRPWMRIQSTRPIKKSWMVVATYHEGWEAQARVSAFGGAAWFDAREVTFLRSHCLFEFSTTTRRLHYVPPVEFSCIVDAAGCTYRLEEEIEVLPGESRQVTLYATNLSGYCQLDYPAHFQLRPGFGTIIRNVEPSVDDVEETGRMFTVIAPHAEKAPIKIVFGGNSMDGGKIA